MEKKFKNFLKLEKNNNKIEKFIINIFSFFTYGDEPFARLSPHHYT